MRKVTELDVDGRESIFIYPDYENEIEVLFKEADKEAGDIVDILYDIDSVTGEELQIWRDEWL